ncbi:MAG: hypothetical protein H2052_11825 [Sphingosinicella sp.]|nr:hypothetical protein [Sphingosinicella sp.]
MGRERYAFLPHRLLKVFDECVHVAYPALVNSLSRRQRQILEALAKGRLNKQIAYELDLTERTIKLHRAAMLRGLGVRTVAEAIRIAIEAGM